MATIHTDFHHGLFGFQRKAIRGFYFVPATGRWTELDPEVLYSFWKDDQVFNFTDSHDTYVHIASCDGYVRHIAVLMLGNENKMDTNRVARHLERIRVDVYQDVKRNSDRLEAVMAS